ncbi:MAG: hypothetical protein IT208_19010 [Chthonomonadales bacterium]|nr:hypothetical protein [Chthonomonadales bacterium]
MPRMTLCAAAFGLAAAFAPAGPPATVLGVDGAQFTLSGRPTFLLGMSYYGALGARDPVVRADLDDMRRRGFNWVRVWATWNAFGEDASAVDGEGRAREPYMGRLRRLLADCDRRGMVVDITLCRGVDPEGRAVLGTAGTLGRAATTLATALRSRRNWYLDMANERNIGDRRFVSFDELKQVRAALRRADPWRLATASQGGDIGRDEMREYIETAGVDLLCPHRPRSAGSPAETAVRTREYRAWMRALGRTAPVHYQEPFRRGYGDWQPGRDDFLSDLRGAVDGGAAGWCLHNGSTRRAPGERPRRSFDLRERRLFEQLDPVERAVADAVGAVVARR